VILKARPYHKAALIGKRFWGFGRLYFREGAWLFNFDDVEDYSFVGQVIMGSKWSITLKRI
jgi:hypothetical protein